MLTIPTFFMSCSLLFESSKSTFAKAKEKAPYDAIIVPGFPHEEDNWSQVVQMRLIWATELYKSGVAKNIIFSGAAVYSPYVESRVMKKYAIAMGVPAENIYTEENAKHSTENLYYSYVRAKELGFNHIALATDPFQTSNLRTFRSKYNLNVALLPVVFKDLKALDHTQPKIDASEDLVENFVSIEDQEGFFERFQGTLGNQIRWREEDLTVKRQIKAKRKKGMLIPKKEILEEAI